MTQLALTVASGADLAVRHFRAHESLSAPFTLSVWARIKDPALDLEAIAGKEASFSLDEGERGKRGWKGIVSFAQQVQVGPAGLTTYYFRLVPTLWLLHERKNLRIYQHLSLREIADRVLDDWGIAREWKIAEDRYPPLEYKVQWKESDYTFLHRILEEAGISYLFADGDSRLVLLDAPEGADLRPSSPIPWVEQPSRGEQLTEYVTAVGLGHDVRPGAFTIRDHDFRRPAYALFGGAEPAPAPEDFYEQYQYGPGWMAIDVQMHASNTPRADDRGYVRHQESYGDERSAKGLAGERADRRTIGFEANFVDLVLGTVFTMAGHPHDELGEEERLLVTEMTVESEEHALAHASGRASFASVPWKPSLSTPKPRIRGVHPAIVVGHPGDEIDPDEFGRVRVQFPWDREGKNDEYSSCWMRVAALWSGLGYGFITLPRIGQEVLVDFEEGDPDRPMVVGRVFDATQPVPYKLPQNKTISTWKSDSSPGSGGFNEIRYEDKAGDELVYIQAERDMRKLVKNDETITVGHDRERHVLMYDTDTTALDRFEVTLLNRTDVISSGRTAVVAGKRERLVKKDRTTVTEDVHVRLAESDFDFVVQGKKRERIGEPVHLHVLSDRRERIDGKQSITVGEDRHEVVEGSYLLQSGRTARLNAGDVEVLHGVSIATMKGAGGFLQIDEGGVTIVGKMVKINAGGSPGSAPPAQPDDPEDPLRAHVEVPDLPQAPPLPPALPEEDADPGAQEWIGIVLVRDDDPDKPVPFARYRVETPSGAVIEGRLDAAGKARIPRLTPGSCKITFPDLDGGAWSEADRK